MCASVWTALRQDRLLFAFQPVVCAATGRVDYFECLLRMRNIDGRIVAGGEFISTLEQLGRISFIDNYVFEQTVRELVNYPGIRLGLNISSLTAREGAWLQLLISRLRHRSDLARRLVVEITETAALDDIEAAARFVDALHNIGCRVAVDDFGAGHTSLRYLQHLAVDMVKIDRSYVRNLSTNSEQQIFLRDLVDLIKCFGFATVAEGIESADDAAFVRAAGVGYLQGYHLGSPTTERAWLRMTPADKQHCIVAA
ncbi:MAG: EAL domain-containing protein [Stellaceae bacterium]|jgi:EAL domain-containing protein (putative c-di-GMP-specific phosphodiesterase class I)